LVFLNKIKPLALTIKMLPFPKFESSIDKKILDRGFDYYEQKNVEEVEVLSNGEFSAIVQGTEEYDVFVKIENENVTEYSCTCPYDWGDVCKHIVAVLYYIRDTEMHDEEYINTIEDDLKEVMSTIPAKELYNYIINYAKRHRGFREDFFEEFG
jgi:uncharacterized Zn finger protein